MKLHGIQWKIGLALLSISCFAFSSEETLAGRILAFPPLNSTTYRARTPKVEPLYLQLGTTELCYYGVSASSLKSLKDSREALQIPLNPINQYPISPAGIHDFIIENATDAEFLRKFPLLSREVVRMNRITAGAVTLFNLTVVPLFLFIIQPDPQVAEQLHHIKEMLFTLSFVQGASIFGAYPMFVARHYDRLMRADFFKDSGWIGETYRSELEDVIREASESEGNSVLSCEPGELIKHPQVRARSRK